MRSWTDERRARARVMYEAGFTLLEVSKCLGSNVRHVSAAIRAAGGLIVRGRNAKPLSIRLWSRVDSSGGPDACWPWTGYRGDFGHGYIAVKQGDGSWRPELVHRVAFELSTGIKLGESFGTHACDNPPCCNPKHIRKGNQESNMKEMAERGRAASGDRNGMRLHPDRVPRGERSGAAKLSNLKVQQARGLHAEGRSRGEIAVLLGVNRSQISRVLSGKAWVSS